MEQMPDEVVVYEYKSGRHWRTKEEWDESQFLKSSPNIVRKAIYKKVEEDDWCQACEDGTCSELSPTEEDT